MRRSPDNDSIAYGTLGKEVVKGFNSAANAQGAALAGAQTSGDYQTRYDRWKIVAQARDFDRNNAIYSACIDRAVNSIMGPHGFSLDVNTTNKTLNERIKDLFLQWTDDPEVRGMFDWAQLQRFVLREIMNVGDILALKIRGMGKLQLIEAERVRTNDHNFGNGGVEQGIRLNRLGRPTAFHVEDYMHRGAGTSGGNWITAQDCIYVANIRHRISATRGLPALQASFSNLHRLNDIMDSEAIAWQRLSRFALAIIKKDAEEFAYNSSDSDPDKAGDTSGDLTDRIHNVDQGTIFWGEEGEDIKGVEQNRPNQHFDQSLRSFLRLITMPLGLPIEIMLMDWEGFNYSNARAAFVQSQAIFRDWQHLLIRSFHRRVFRWLTGMWVKSGELVLPKSMTFAELDKAHMWHVPAFPWVDPEKEAKAWGVQLDRSLTTHTEAIAARGMDRDELNDQREREIRDAIERANKISEETGTEVPWQSFAGLDVQKSGQQMPQPQQPEPQQPQPKTEPEEDEDE